MTRFLYKIHAAQFFNFIKFVLGRCRSEQRYLDLFRNGYLDRWQANLLLKEHHIGETKLKRK